jgi:RHS repeat-associated protein
MGNLQNSYLYQRANISKSKLNIMKKYNKKLSMILLPIMVWYTFLPCISYAGSETLPGSKTTTSHYAASAANEEPSTKSLTYYCQGSTVMDSADSRGNMSSYLGREVRSIIKIGGNITTDYLIKNGKDVIADTDADGKVKETYQFTPYGKPVDFENTNPTLSTQHPTLSIDVNPFRYSSYYSDEESGLYYLNARYYSPEFMRFISRDTYNLYNRYAYANGNPISNVDPTGHFSIPGLLVDLAVNLIIKFTTNESWKEFAIGMVAGFALDGLLEGGYFLYKGVTEGVKNGAKVVNKVENFAGVSKSISSKSKSSIQSFMKDEVSAATYQKELKQKFLAKNQGDLIGEGSSGNVYKHDNTYVYKTLNNHDSEVLQEEANAMNKYYKNTKVPKAYLADNKLYMPYLGPSYNEVFNKGIFKLDTESLNELSNAFNRQVKFDQKRSFIINDSHTKNYTVDLNASDFEKNIFRIRRIDVELYKG